MHHEVVVFSSACINCFLLIIIKGMNSSIGILEQRKKRTLHRLDVSLLSWGGEGGCVTACCAYMCGC